MLANHLVRVLVEPRCVAELHGRRSGERAEQRVEQGDVLLTGWRELQQHRTQPLAQESDSPAEDPGQADPVETLGRIGESAICLHAEAKAGRSLRRPFRKGRLRRCAVEAAVELDSVEPLGVVAEHLRAGELLRIELAFPACVAEAGRPGEEHRGYETAAWLFRITRSCSCPQAASASRPRVSRTVTFNPCASIRVRNARIAARSGAR